MIRKVLHINFEDWGGGASRAAFRLHKGLLHLGEDSGFFVLKKRTNEATVTAFRPSVNISGRVRRRFRRELISRHFAFYRASRPEGLEPFSDDRSEFGIEMAARIPPSHVINLHWVAGFLDYRSFFCRVPFQTPVVWTLHDMNAFTGGCHYDNGCGKSRNACGACPQLGSKDDRDLSYQIWLRKHKIYKTIPPDRLHFVTPSRWLAHEVNKSSLLGRFPVSVIPNGVDTTVFSPRNGTAVRDALEIPHHARVILFVSHLSENHRKGFSLLASALEGIEESKNLYLISLGHGNPQMKLQIPHLHLGHVENDLLLSLVYSIADIFTITSSQDNLPNTCLESLACGTPVVGFAVGGVLDIVRPGITGLLAPPQDVNELRHAIQKALNDSDRLGHMRVHCRRIALEEYSVEIQARRYRELYQEMMARVSSGF